CGGGFNADVALVTMDLVRAGAGTDVFLDVTAATDEAQARAGRRIGRDRRPGDVQSRELGAGRGDEGTLAKRAQQGVDVLTRREHFDPGTTECGVGQAGRVITSEGVDTIPGRQQPVPHRGRVSLTRIAVRHPSVIDFETEE